MASVTGLDGGDGSGELGLLRELCAGLPAGVAYVAGPDLVFKFANEEYRRIAGGRELIGLPLRRALPELAGERLDMVERAARTGRAFRGRESEIWIRGPGGAREQLFMDFVYQPVRDDAGRVAGVLLFGSDVTQHVRRGRELRDQAVSLAESEERYRRLFETLPLGVVYYEADGSVVAANPAARAILALDVPGAATWPMPGALGALHEDGTPIRREDFPVLKALRTGEVAPDVVMAVPRGRAGELRWLRVTSVPDAVDEQGRPRRAYAMFTDITEERRAEATVRESTKLLGYLRDANILGVVANSEQGVLDANDAFLDMVGYSRGAMEAGRLSSHTLTAPEYASQDEAALRQLRATGVAQPYAKEYIHRDGHRVHVIVGGAVTSWSPLRWVVYAVDITARQRSERERAELLAREQVARVEAGAAADRLALLLGAGDLVASTGNRRELLDRAARLLAQALADYCVVFLPTAQGMLRAVSLADRDPAREAMLQGLREIDLRQAGPLLPQVAFTEAAAQLATNVSALMPTWSRAAPKAADVAKVAGILESSGAESAIAAPLLVGQRPLGVLMLGRRAGRASFTGTDMPLITELSRRLAVGLANAETFAREHTVAETLQHALLPDAPPEIAGLDIAVRYLPATDGVHVGGDWYDAFPVGPGRAGLAIGDVAGHSIGAASIMGQIRSLLRAHALEHPAPADVLGRTNEAVSRLLPETVATVFYAVLDLSTGDLAYASAGHPPPLLASAGHTEYLDDTPGVMLGVSEDTAYPAGARRLRPGARLLLYTDGLIEDRQRDITQSLSALARAMRLSRFGTAEQTCRFVHAALLGARARADDVCLLAARLQPRTKSSRATPLPSVDSAAQAGPPGFGPDAVTNVLSARRQRRRRSEHGGRGERGGCC